MEITLKGIPLKVVNIPWRNNNLSNLNTDPPLSEQGETIIGVYLLVLGWLSWFGNSLVMFVLYRQRASLQPTDVLTLNLAISDASISVFGYSRGILEIFNIFKDDRFLITWIWTCQVDGFFTLLFGLASINTLTVISVTRYIKGCHPNKVTTFNLFKTAPQSLCSCVTYLHLDWSNVLVRCSAAGLGKLHRSRVWHVRGGLVQSQLLHHSQILHRLHSHLLLFHPGDDHALLLRLHYQHGEKHQRHVGRRLSHDTPKEGGERRHEDFHCNLHCFHHGLVTICSGVYVVSLGLSCAKHDQHRHPSLCQVCQLLQPSHLLRHELQVSPGCRRAAAVHAGTQGGGASAALSEPQTQS
ncbi:uncharacterized protein LOC125018934 isoform X2 [Mugil cephalus]|uniref:uncharacterized protein LOC125018934 isoform X2 n=1 Tax=Mugil cephalus TaxID=48193 RepID=UPI001FB5A55C|nr:uncharacterized protein LOC125018934 isoform X2 [Mugil cephalus]